MQMADDLEIITAHLRYSSMMKVAFLGTTLVNTVIPRGASRVFSPFQLLMARLDMHQLNQVSLVSD